MREQKCIIASVGGSIVARVVQRVYGEARWLLVEEYDVTGDFRRIVEALHVEPAMTGGNTDGEGTKTSGPDGSEGGPARGGDGAENGKPGEGGGAAEGG